MLNDIYNAKPMKKPKKKEVRFLPEIEIRYNTLDMNDPDNLRNFLLMLGMPFRSYKEIQEELALTFMRKLVSSIKIDKQNTVFSFERKIENLKN